MKLNKKVFTKYFSFIISFFVVMVIPNKVLASNEGIIEIKIDDVTNYYGTLEEAITSVPDNTETTLTLLDNIALNKNSMLNVMVTPPALAI